MGSKGNDARKDAVTMVHKALEGGAIKLNGASSPDGAEAGAVSDALYLTTLIDQLSKILYEQGQ